MVMKNKLASVADTIDQRLKTVFDHAFSRESNDFFNPVPPLEINLELQALTLRGGKRLRPALMVAAYELFDDNALENDTLLDAACAMELLQSYFLIHDDIMDGDSVRRGGASVHASLQQKTGDAHMGVYLGILAGDLGVALHEWVLSQLSCAPRTRQRLHQLFSRMHMDVVMGQTLDLQGTASPEDIVSRKTASYTTVGPLCCGAAIGGATEHQLAQIAAMARPLGVAFQYRDDLIGMFGDEKVAGKPVGSDLRNGKRTLLLTDAIAHLTDDDRDTLTSLLDTSPLNDDALTRALALIEKSGARARCEKRIDILCQEVLGALSSLTLRKTGTAFLEWLTRLLAYREM